MIMSFIDNRPGCYALHISDAISRHDYKEMQTIGAMQQHPSLDKLLARVADDQTYANGNALGDILQLQLQNTIIPLTGRVDSAGANVEQNAPAQKATCCRSTSTPKAQKGEECRARSSRLNGSQHVSPCVCV